MSRASEEVGALLNLGRHHDAARRAAELLPANPDDRLLRLNAALAFSCTGDAGPAEHMIGDTVRRWPDDAETLRIASIVHGRLGHKDRAFDFAQRAVAREPSSASMHRQLAHAGANLRSRRSLAAAEASAREAVRIAPNDAAAHNALGAVQRARRRNREAVTSFGKAVELEPNTAVYHQNIAAALATLGRKREASEHLVAAGRADPTNPEPIKALRNLAKVSVPFAAIVAVQVVRMALTGVDEPASAPPATFPATSPSTISSTISSTHPSTSGTSAAMVILVIVCLVLLGVIVFRAARRRGQGVLSPEAKRVLDLDRQMRKRRFGRN